MRLAGFSEFLSILAIIYQVDYFLIYLHAKHPQLVSNLFLFLFFGFNIYTLIDFFVFFEICENNENKHTTLQKGKEK